MEFKILVDEKNKAEVEFDNLTLAELLRVYLNRDSTVEFVAWKKEHATMNPVLAVETKGKTAKKALSDAVEAITKELDSIENDFKKLK